MFETLMLVLGPIIGAIAGGWYAYKTKLELDERRWWQDRNTTLTAMYGWMLREAGAIRDQEIIVGGLWTPVSQILTDDAAKYIFTIRDNEVQGLIRVTDTIIRRYNTVASKFNEGSLDPENPLVIPTEEAANRVEEALMETGMKLQRYMKDDLAKERVTSEPSRERILMLLSFVSLVAIGLLFGQFLIEDVPRDTESWILPTFFSGALAGIISSAIWWWR